MRGSDLRRLRQQVDIRQIEIAAGMEVHRNRIWIWEKEDLELPKWAELSARQLLTDVSWLEATKRGRRKRQRNRRMKRLGYDGFD